MFLYSLLLGFQVGPAAGYRIDFFINYTGYRLAREGTSPYDLALIRGIVERHLSEAGAEEPTLECGFFQPPESFLVMAPFAALSWPAADILWLSLLTALGMSCGSLAWTFGRSPARRDRGFGILVALLLLNPLTLRAVSLGQTPLYLAGCVALGQLAFERGWSSLGAVCWGLTGIKPHLALPLLMAAFVIGGWRRALPIAAVIALTNLLGGLFLGNPFETIQSYITFLGTAHKQVGFNRITNDQLVSWNRLLFAVGGPAVELGPALILAGYAVAALLLYVRHGRQPGLSPSWVLAATVVWGLFTNQAHGYELVLLVLTAPYLFLLADANRRTDLIALLLLFGVASIPRSVVNALALHLAPAALLPLLLSYRAILVALLAAYFVIRKPVGICATVPGDKAASDSITCS
jgi:hypothetical protein